MTVWRIPITSFWTILISAMSVAAATPVVRAAPVVAVRDQNHPVPGTIGKPIIGTQAKIVDESNNALPPGQKGVLLVKGPQIMPGYFEREDLTRQIISQDGWLNTGDLGMITINGEIKITGRAKDTIVLLGGENIEPAPIEDKLRESVYIDQVVVLGQDQKFLSALIVPTFEVLQEFAAENKIAYKDNESLIDAPKIKQLVDNDVRELISEKNGFREWEGIYKTKLLTKKFEVNRELSHKQEVMRHAINDIYKKEIQTIYT